MKKNILILILLTSTTLFSQTSINNYLIDWERSKNHSLAILKEMPEDKFNVKASLDVRSFSEEFKHIVGSTYYMMSTALTIEAPKVDLESISSKDEMISTVSNCYDWVIKSLSTYDESKNSDIIELFGRVKVSKERAIYKIYEHQAHHKSKAIVTQRVAGIKPPDYMLFD
jgi:uncharacterized damage-inducible protein DinB